MRLHTAFFATFLATLAVITGSAIIATGHTVVYAHYSKAPTGSSKEGELLRLAREFGRGGLGVLLGVATRSPDPRIVANVGAGATDAGGRAGAPFP
jgi:hypothetical protein